MGKHSQSCPINYWLFYFLWFPKFIYVLQVFHIDIFNYLDTSEILVAFLNLLNETIIDFAIFIGYILIVKLFFWVLKKFNIRKKKVQAISESKTPAQSDLLNDFNKISLTMIFAALVMCIVYLMRANSIEIDSAYIVKNKDWMSSILFAFTIGAGFWIFAQLEVRTKESIWNMIIFFALFFISSSLSKAIDKIEITVNNTDLKSVVILEKDTIQTRKDYIYVGRTNKFVFFYDINKKNADVIPQEGIKKISFSYLKSLK